MTRHDLSASRIEALVERIGGMEGVCKVLSGEWIVGAPSQVATGRPGNTLADLLEPIGDPIALSATDRFAARDRFVVDRHGELPISYIGDDFAANFLGLVEEHAGAARLRQYRLVESSIDLPIFAALGGQERARIGLAHLFGFLKTADRKRWFFCYVADLNRTLWAVDTYWRDGGWDMEAYSITYPRGWRGGGCVVSGAFPDILTASEGADHG